MQIAFRTDASSLIGTGHFMRCLTLADELNRRGATCRFLCRHLPEHFQKLLAEKGHEFTRLAGTPSEADSGLAHARWLGASQKTDAQDALRALADQAWDWLVVDHYALDERWETPLRQAAKRILAIDDLADRRHDCDVLLDQNLHENMDGRYAGKVPGHCRLLLGPRYALLREEFRRLRETVKPRSGTIKRILVFFGGADTESHTAKAIAALAEFGETLKADVVIGLQHPCRKEIEAACVQYKFTCHVQTDRMAELMAAADLAIGAGGSATWERCCLGLPALVVVVASNQCGIAQALDDCKAGECLSWNTFDMQNVLRDKIIELSRDGVRVALMSKKALALVDGQGVQRVADGLGSAA
jgi:UDP-2,4-diacetamido-2,4,6-trideoxy-beta-L-altropyranose hydrolase